MLACASKPRHHPGRQPATLAGWTAPPSPPSSPIGASPPTAPARPSEAQRAGADGWAEVGTLPAALRARLEERCPSGRSRRTPAPTRATARSSGACAPPTARGRGRPDRARRGPAHGLRVEPGGLRPGLPLLRHRRDGRRPRPHGRRDRRPGGAGRHARPTPRAPGSPTSSSWAWASRMQNLDAVLDAGRRDQRPPTGSACRPAGSRSRPSAGSRASPGWPSTRCRCGWPSRCTRPTTATRCGADADQRALPDREPAGRVPALLRPTGRRVFIEYLLLDGVNDAPADARRLARLLRDGRFHVNVIEYNPADRRRLPRELAARAARCSCARSPTRAWRRRCAARAAPTWPRPAASSRGALGREPAEVGRRPRRSRLQPERLQVARAAKYSSSSGIRRASSVSATLRTTPALSMTKRRAAGDAGVGPGRRRSGGDRRPWARSRRAGSCRAGRAPRRSAPERRRAVNRDPDHLGVVAGVAGLVRCADLGELAGADAAEGRG